MEPFVFKSGTAPVLLSMPHSGVFIPPKQQARMTPAALDVPDTDWHLPQLYDFLEDLGIGAIRATHSRYVIDLNRDPGGQPLYPGANNTELCPTTSFSEAPLYRTGEQPDEAEIEARRAKVWQPYHDKIASELAAIREKHGVAVLWDAHSIRSEVPRFFDGRLTDLNLGSGGGVTAAPELLNRLGEIAKVTADYSFVIDGRFKGGYITRHYGDPANNIHAIQLEQSWATYMNEDPPFGFREDLATGVRPVLRRFLESVAAWARDA
ncbi:N-formylglutamate deformylase [Denitrobaculum tricleocarpae]|uniref:N-formylglutamate deformylase n=1 Tax=Denitrobaculum tricleocarpae TaxID=2591009 RepID=A0A545TKM2_9PROT|nr:N-formylglutamate deformylase [Denitrobaculum tricleocarpae]TQV77773.1 N-formylglutamate deformylase [Denitrobaculum tricleocarpae]